MIYAINSRLWSPTGLVCFRKPNFLAERNTEMWNSEVMAAPTVRNCDRVRGSSAHSREGRKTGRCASTEVSKSNDEVRRQTWTRKAQTQGISKGHLRKTRGIAQHYFLLLLFLFSPIFHCAVFEIFFLNSTHCRSRRLKNRVEFSRSRKITHR